MNVVYGDLLHLAREGEFDVIIHGCNCFCTMGAGIAKSVKMSFPEAFKADKLTVKGDKDKLGTYSCADFVIEGHHLSVVNAYTQFDWRGKGLKVDYKAIKNVFMAIQKDFSGKRIAYPLIGAGLAGGDWTIIFEIIESALDGEDHTLVKYKG